MYINSFFRSSALFVIVFLMFCGALRAQDNIAADFAKWLPDMASSDPKLKETSQQSWQKICMSSGAKGQESLKKEVNRLMTEQLSQNIPVDTKVWLLFQLRYTGDADVVPAVAEMLKDVQTRVRDEATRTLAQISDPSAAASLEKALKASDNVSEKQRLQAAISARNIDLSVPNEKQMPQALPYASKTEIAAWMKKFDSLSDQEKAQTLASLKIIKDKTYLPVVLKSLQSENSAVKTAAILALETVGDADNVNVLIENRIGDYGNAASSVLRFSVAPGIDDALLKSLQSLKNDTRRFVFVAEDIAARNNIQALPIILNYAKEKKGEWAEGLLRAAEPLATTENIKDFVDIILSVQERREREECEKITARLCNKNAAPVIALLNDDNAGALFTLIGRIGGKEAIETVRKAQATPAHKEAAFQALCNWPDASVYEDLMKFVEDDVTSPQNKISALRGAIRVISLPDEQIGIRINNKGRLDALKKAISLSTRNNEIQLVLERAAAVRDIGSIQLALPYLEQEAFRERACRTIVDVAHHDNVRRPNKDVAGPALDKVLQLSTDGGLKDRAKKYRDNM